MANLDFSDAFEASVEAKMTAEQDALRAEQEKKTAVVKAEQAKEVAAIEAEAAIPVEEAVDDDDYALLFGTEQPAGKAEKVEKATEKAEKKNPV